MIVEDQGAGIDRPRADEWEVNQLPEGGMGMAIMRAVVDELDITAGADGRGTVVHMTKYFAAHRLAEPESVPSSARADSRESESGSTRSSVVISKMRRALPCGRTIRAVRS